MMRNRWKFGDLRHERGRSRGKIEAASALLLSMAFVSAGAFPCRAEDAIWKLNSSLNRGINLGGALEAPVEGGWGVTLKSEYFRAIHDAGFKSVRVPIRWSAHAAADLPYTIDPAFFSRVDWVVQQSMAQHLNIVIDVHHDVRLYQDPEKEEPRLLALWDQIAAHYQAYPENLFFELVNEPYDQLTDERWDALIPVLLEHVRRTNPDRAVIVGPGYWNSPDHLDTLRLPDSDRQLIVTFHYYAPTHFTHQGAFWVPGADQWKNITWDGTAEERQAIYVDFDKAAAWGLANHRPLYLGEFGSYQTADMTSRARWTGAVVQAAETHHISWAYWEFCSTFGAYDPQAAVWRQPLLRALLSD
jgi:endoglucanase